MKESSQNGIEVGTQAMLLPIDTVSLPFRRRACLYMTRPEVRREPVVRSSPIESDRPDNMCANFYGSVLHEEGPFGGKYRMWYYAEHLGRNPDWEGRKAKLMSGHKENWFMGPCCYAESHDGVNWFKPKLGQLMFKGSKDNNAFDLPDPMTLTVNVIRDDDDPDPARRYKIAYEVPPKSLDQADTMIHNTHFHTAVSEDGIVWKNVRNPLADDSYLENASLYKHNGLYIVNGHTHTDHVHSEGGALMGRQGYVFVSPDFDRWLDASAESFKLPEPADPAQRSADGRYDQVHIGVGAASFENVCIGVYGVWHNAPYQGHFGEISCDLGLVVSNDGIGFREPVKGFVWLDRHESPHTPVAGHDYNTCLCQGNGILNVDDKTLIYHGRWLNAEDANGVIEAHYSAEIGLATLDRDRWGSLRIDPGHQDAEVWSAPVRVPDQPCDVVLNCDGAQGINIEIADERFSLLQGLSAQNAARPVGSGGLDCQVQWPKKTFADLAGQTVRLRINMQRTDTIDPHLYAVYLRTR
jgi:hypothetical protein